MKFKEYNKRLVLQRAFKIKYDCKECNKINPITKIKKEYCVDCKITQMIIKNTKNNLNTIKTMKIENDYEIENKNEKPTHFGNIYKYTITRIEKWVIIHYWNRKRDAFIEGFFTENRVLRIIQELEEGIKI